MCVGVRIFLEHQRFFFVKIVLDCLHCPSMSDLALVRVRLIS